MPWVVITEADDGTLGAVGPFRSERAAARWADGHKTEESAFFCHVQPLEKPEA